MTLASKIEAILFWKGEPMKVKKLATLLGVTAEQITTALDDLEQALVGRGIVLVRKEDEVLLGSAPEISQTIAQLTKEELSKNLGRAGLETLAIILYKGNVTRREIDYIRGVNSAFIVRNLMVRGLIEREQKKNDQRSFIYKPTFALFGHLSLKRLENLPEFAAVKEELALFEKAVTEDENRVDILESNS